MDTQVLASADGTPIEYLSLGHGPAVIAIPGSLAVAADLTAFATLLARRHAVHIVQRRGRGASGPQGDQYGIARECADIEAVRAQTGARLLFGHSFGGLVALRAACDAGKAYDAVAVYEPGVSVNGSISVGWLDQARREVAAGADFAAFLTFARGVNPSQTGRLPRWLLRLIMRRVITPAELRQNLALMPQAINEHTEVGRLDQHVDDYREITAATLLMHGQSPFASAQVPALARLAETIPQAEVSAFPGLDHFAPKNKPGELADAVLRFFAAHAA